MAPPEAIVCAPAMFEDPYAEQEYVVDRRRLTGVKVSAEIIPVRGRPTTKQRRAEVN